MQPSPPTPAFVSEHGLTDHARGLAQAPETNELQRVDSHHLRDSDKLASGMLEQGCVLH